LSLGISHLLSFAENTRVTIKNLTAEVKALTGEVKTLKAELSKMDSSKAILEQENEARST